MAPPMMADISLPLDMAISSMNDWGIISGRILKKSEAIQMAKTVLNPKPLPNTFNAINNNTKLIIKYE